MLTLDLSRKTSGKIWHRKPIVAENGLVVSIYNSIYTNLSLPTRSVRFLHADFDVSCERFIASDHHGNVFMFDLSRNRFSLVQRTGSPCTAVSFKLRRKTEILAAMSDYSMKCYDTDTKELVAWMKGHNSTVHEIAMHESGRYALTTSCDATYLWDLNTFERKRNMNRKEGVDILSVFFIPLSNVIVTCFKDDSIFMWDSDMLNYKYQLPVPLGPAPQYRTFTVTRDGRRFVAGGRSRFLHVWTLDNRKIYRVIELPQKVTAVCKLLFIPDSFDNVSNEMLGVLGQDGIMRFINVASCKLLFDIGSPEARINDATVSQNGRYLVAIMDIGNVNLYNIHSLCAEFTQPPAPLVKVVDADRTADTERSTSRSLTAENTESRGFIASSDSVNGLNINKLKVILKGYGEYPEKYRLFIWRTLLDVPENHSAYAALLDKGIHPAYSKIHETYPVKSRKLLRVLQRVLSALAHWAPIFSETDYLPALVFPFIKLFQNNHLICFEVLASVFLNWCDHWFEYFPNPPVNVLSMVENIISHHDNELLRHLVKHSVTSQIYAWPLLQTLFSEVLTREEWLMMWDNIFSSHPSFLLMAVAAYVVTARGALLHCIELDDFKFFFRHHNSLDIKRVIKEARRMNAATPHSIHPKDLLSPYTPLTTHQYPVFNKYPKFIVDYQIQERERIREEEIDYLKYKQAALDLEKESLQKHQEEAAWYRQQRLLADAEEKRRRLIEEEEERLKQQRSKLLSMQKEMKIKELNLLEESRKKFLVYQSGQREVEIQRLDDEAKRKAEQRVREGHEAAASAQIQSLESQLQKSLLEQDMFRAYNDEDRQVRSVAESGRRDDELNSRLHQKLQDLEAERESCVRKLLKSSGARLEGIGGERRDVSTTTNGSVARDGHERLGGTNDGHEHLGGTNDGHERLGGTNYGHERLGGTNYGHERLGSTNNGHERLGGTNNGHDQLYINDSASSSPTIQFSLDRGRTNFDVKSSQLLEDVRDMRSRLAKEGRGMMAAR